MSVRSPEPRQLYPSLRRALTFRMDTTGRSLSDKEPRYLATVSVGLLLVTVSVFIVST